MYFFYSDIFQIFTVNGRSLTRSNHMASNGVVHTVDRFVYSASWASCGRYIETSPELSELQEALERVDLLDPLFGSLRKLFSQFNKKQQQMCNIVVILFSAKGLTKCSQNFNLYF